MSSQDDGLARSGGQDDELARGLGGLDRGDRLELCHLPATWDQVAAGFASGMGPPSPRPHASTQLCSRRRGRLRSRSAPGPTRSSTAPTGGGGSCGDGRARCEAGRLRTFPVRTSRPAPWAWPVLASTAGPVADGRKRRARRTAPGGLVAHTGSCLWATWSPSSAPCGGARPLSHTARRGRWCDPRPRVPDSPVQAVGGPALT